MTTLTNYEKETIILFNEEEATARIETFNGRLLRECEKAQKNCPEIICEEKTDGYGVYIVPKKLVKIHTPRILSETEKKRMSEVGKRLGKSNKKKFEAN